MNLSLIALSCGPEFEDVVILMLARFNSRQVPKNSTALRDALLKVASYTCVSQPHFAACEMKRGMLSAHPELWKRCSKMVLIQAYGILIPNSQRVLEMIKEPVFKNSQEQSVFDYLRHFIVSLKKLLFITGKPHCGLYQITITYHSNIPEGL